MVENLRDFFYNSTLQRSSWWWDEWTEILCRSIDNHKMKSYLKIPLRSSWIFPQSNEKKIIQQHWDSFHSPSFIESVIHLRQLQRILFLFSLCMVDEKKRNDGRKQLKRMIKEGGREEKNLWRERICLLISISLYLILIRKRKSLKKEFWVPRSLQHLGWISWLSFVANKNLEETL